MKVLNKKTVAKNILKNKSEEIESSAEAEVLVTVLENIAKDYQYPVLCLSAPEVNIFKRIAIIRTDKKSLNLINPVVMSEKNRVLSLQEACVSFDGTHNCLRYSTIFIQNGFNKEIIKLEGQEAILAQHAIDHLNGITYHERVVKMAVIRKDGRILKNDFCVCGSKKRFEECCDANK